MLREIILFKVMHKIYALKYAYSFSLQYSIHCFIFLFLTVSTIKKYLEFGKSVAS